MTRNQAIVDASSGGFAEYNEWKRNKEEEKRLADQYGIPYGEEVGDAQE